MYENDNEIEEVGTAPVNVYENDNEDEEVVNVPVNVYENDEELECDDTAPRNVYEKDNEDVMVSHTSGSHINVYENDHELVSPDPVSELHGNEYENDDEDVASIHCVAVHHSYVYENDDEVFIESVVQEQTDVHENGHEELASTFVLENGRGRMMSNDLEEGMDVDEYDSDDGKAKYASSKSVYGNENRKAAPATVQLLYKNSTSVEGTSKLIYGKDKDETATAANLYVTTNVDLDKEYL
ncbi:hypothetical protein Bbelb_279500 [Branchiostoma belcheri]|nr:hypothetical protein Bbelb_279500 [Branchiostoma belcheri]